MVRYSIVVAHYEMVDTVERSLRSILGQIGDDFEVVVVDGGSTDGSRRVLSRLESECDRLRVIELDPDPGRKLGADRQHSIEAARGKYVLPQLDADDVYEPVIGDFVELYHQLESGIEGEFFLSGTGINMAPRSLLISTPYRNLASSEDRDLWRRLLAEDALIWLEHKPLRREIGYEHSFIDEIRRDISDKVADAQVGLLLRSCLKWSVRSSDYYILEQERGPVGRILKTIYDLFTYPYAYWIARYLPRYETPEPFRYCGALEREIGENRRTVSEIESDYGISIDRSRLSDRGRELLCVDDS